MTKQDIGKYIGLVIISPLLIGLVLIVLAFILLLSPIAGVTFLGYTALNTLNDIHRRNKNFKLKTKQNERNKLFYSRQ